MSNFVSSESSRCLHCKNPQCAVGCPVHFDTPAFLAHCKGGNFAEAVKTVGHLFGEVCGYVCPRDKQCKGHCILGKVKNPIDVGAVERNVFAEHFPRLEVQDDSLSHLKIAVVGGGVSGVTFAEQCYRHGANVTIYEKNQLLHTIRSVPSFRLPKAALQRILDAVKNSGIKVEKQSVDSAMLKSLTENFDAVYLATGVTVPNKIGVDEKYVTYADDFLRGNNFGKTIVVGGGNTAMDCARLNAANGQETIVAYRRSRGDMPAFPQEIDAAEQENVRFCFNLAPVAVEKRRNLVVTFAKMVSEGRGKLTVTDETLTMECDYLVAATGNKFDVSVYPTERFVTVDENNCVHGNLYAGGDATGKSLVAEAVSDALNAFRNLREKYKR